MSKRDGNGKRFTCIRFAIVIYFIINLNFHFVQNYLNNLYVSANDTAEYGTSPNVPVHHTWNGNSNQQVMDFTRLLKFDVSCDIQPNNYKAKDSNVIIICTKDVIKEGSLDITFDTSEKHFLGYSHSEHYVSFYQIENDTRASIINLQLYPEDKKLLSVCLNKLLNNTGVELFCIDFNILMSIEQYSIYKKFRNWIVDFIKTFKNEVSDLLGDTTNDKIQDLGNDNYIKDEGNRKINDSSESIKRDDCIYESNNGLISNLRVEGGAEMLTTLDTSCHSIDILIDPKSTKGPAILKIEKNITQVTNLEDVFYSMSGVDLGIAPLEITLDDFYKRNPGDVEKKELILTAFNTRTKQNNSLIINVDHMKDKHDDILVLSTSNVGNAVKFSHSINESQVKPKNKDLNYNLREISVNGNTQRKNRFIINALLDHDHEFAPITVSSKEKLYINGWRIRSNEYRMILMVGTINVKVIDTKTNEILRNVDIITRNPKSEKLGLFSSSILWLWIPAVIFVTNVLYKMVNVGVIDNLYTIMIISVLYTGYNGVDNKFISKYLIITEYINLVISQKFQIFIDTGDNYIYNDSIIGTKLIFVAFGFYAFLFFYIGIIAMGSTAKRINYLIENNDNLSSDLDFEEKKNKRRLLRQIVLIICEKIIIFGEALHSNMDAKELEITISCGYIFIMAANMILEIYSHKINSVYIMGFYIWPYGFLLLSTLNIIILGAIGVSYWLIMNDLILKRIFYKYLSEMVYVGYNNDELYNTNNKDLEKTYSILNDGYSNIDPKELNKSFYVLHDRYTIEYEGNGFVSNKKDKPTRQLLMRVLNIFEHGATENKCSYKSRFDDITIGYCHFIITLNGRETKKVIFRGDISADQLRIATLLNNYVDIIIKPEPKQIIHVSIIETLKNADDKYRIKFVNLLFLEMFIAFFWLLSGVLTKRLFSGATIIVSHLLLISIWLYIGICTIKRESVMDNQNTPLLISNSKWKHENEKRNYDTSHIVSQQSKLLILKALTCFFNLATYLLIFFFGSDRFGICKEMIVMPLVNSAVNTSWIIEKISSIINGYFIIRNSFIEASGILKKACRFILEMLPELIEQYFRYIPILGQWSHENSPLSIMNIRPMLHSFVPSEIYSQDLDLKMFDDFGLRYYPVTNSTFTKKLYIHPKVDLSFNNYHQIVLVKECEKLYKDSKSQTFAIIEYVNVQVINGNYVLINEEKNKSFNGDIYLPLSINIPDLDEFKTVYAHDRLTCIDYNHERKVVDIFGTFITPRQKYTVSAISKHTTNGDNRNREILLNSLCIADGELSLFIMDQIDMNKEIFVTQVLTQDRFQINSHCATLEERSKGSKISIYDAGLRFGYEYIIELKTRSCDALQNFVYEVTADSILSKISVPIKINQSTFHYFSYEYLVTNEKGITQSIVPEGHISSNKNKLGFHCPYLFPSGKVLFEDPEYGYCTNDGSNFLLENDYFVNRNWMGDVNNNGGSGIISNFTFNISSKEYIPSRNMSFLVPITIIGKLGECGTNTSYYRVMQHYGELARDLSGRVAKLEAFAIHLGKYNGLGINRIAAEFFTRADLLIFFSNFKAFRNDEHYPDIIQNGLLVALNIAIRFCIANLNDFIAILQKLENLKWSTNVQLLMDVFDRLAAKQTTSIAKLSQDTVELAIQEKIDQCEVWNCFLFPYVLKSVDIQPILCPSTLVSGWIDDISKNANSYCNHDSSHFHDSMSFLTKVLKHRLLDVSNKQDVDFCHIIVPRINSAIHKECLIGSHFGFVRATLHKDQSHQELDMYKENSRVLWVPCMATLNCYRIRIHVSKRIECKKELNWIFRSIPASLEECMDSNRMTAIVYNGKITPCKDHLMALDTLEFRDFGTMASFRVSECEYKIVATVKGLEYEIPTESIITFRFSNASQKLWSAAIKAINAGKEQRLNI
ncbi:hypothetical protein BdWA1_001176 [Babesia duncani]|uniref:Uncharacterized protein n=1 Tax=Babesia duncani TaxID=323732 RepID=A0AAD9PPD4_9APIC|nr:hypothetical protein BdWA1_001176 [Babesia duncani]